MKKRTLALIMAMTLAASLTLMACGSSDQEEKHETNDEANAEAMTEEEDSDDSAAEDGASDAAAKDSAYYEQNVYGDLLKDYYQIISITLEAATDDTADTSAIEDLAMNTPGATGLQECVYSEPDTAMDCLGYELRDVSGDGIPELLVGYSGESNPDVDSDSMVYALFTCVNDEPVNVFEGWYRNKYFTKADNTFGYYGSSGAASSAFGICHLTEDGTTQVWDDFYFSDYADDSFETIAYYHNTTGEWDPSTSEVLDISDKDFWNMDEQIEAEKEPLILTSFAKFAQAE